MIIVLLMLYVGWVLAGMVRRAGDDAYFQQQTHQEPARRANQ